MKYKSLLYIPLILQLIFTPYLFTQMISFYPQTDTIRIVGACTFPSFVCNSPNYLYWPIRITIEPGLITRMEYSDNSGNTHTIDECYFMIEDNMFEYEAWFLPLDTAYNDTQLVTFDSSLTVMPTIFGLKLLVKDQGFTIDSLTQGFIGIMEPLIINTRENYIIPEIELSSTYPNPFNSMTTINFKLSKACMIDLSVYSLNGQLVSTLKKEFCTSGEYSYVWNADKFSTGIYLIILRNDHYSSIRKCILLN